MFCYQYAFSQIVNRKIIALCPEIVNEIHMRKKYREILKFKKNYEISKFKSSILNRANHNFVYDFLNTLSLVTLF